MEKSAAPADQTRKNPQPSERPRCLPATPSLLCGQELRPLVVKITVARFAGTMVGLLKIKGSLGHEIATPKAEPKFRGCIEKPMDSGRRTARRY